MNNEETIIDPQYTTESKQTETTSVEQPTAETKATKKEMGWGEKAAYAAGGAVVGAGMTAAGQAMAAPTEEINEQPQEEGEEVVAEAVAVAVPEENAKPEESNEVTGVTVEANGTIVHVSGDAKVEIENGNVHVTASNTVHDVHVEQPAPAPEDVIVATATGVRVAQVDDNASFSQAFADARAQVGPGGVFEWHGRVYGTYYKDEWDNMTAEEKHEYQASIDYKDVLSDDSVAQHHNDLAQHNVHHDSNVHRASYEEAGNDVSDEVEVEVLQVGQVDLNEDGIPETAALLEVNGHEVMIVDIDQDGVADIALADASDANIFMPEMSAGDEYLAQADAAPDYMNDANVGIFEA